jgi:hypothetical protein
MHSNEGMIVNTGDEQRRSTLTTTINPRLRPKASSNVSSIFPPPVTASPRLSTKYNDNYTMESSSTVKQSNVTTSNVSSTIFSQPSALNSSSDVERPMEQMKISQISTESTNSSENPLNYQRTMSSFNDSHQVDNAKPATPGSTLRTSAFQ